MTYIKGHYSHSSKGKRIWVTGHYAKKGKRAKRMHTRHSKRLKVIRVVTPQDTRTNAEVLLGAGKDIYHAGRQLGAFIKPKLHPNSEAAQLTKLEEEVARLEKEKVLKERLKELQKKKQELAIA